MGRHLLAVGLALLAGADCSGGPAQRAWSLRRPLDGCSSPESGACHPTDQQACTCADGRRGYQDCGAAGAFGACRCAGGASASSGPPTGTGSSTGSGTGGATDAGLRPFLSPCTDDSQCATLLCFPFNAKGPHCTMKCTSPSDCPAPSPGCSGMGVCKAP